MMLLTDSIIFILQHDSALLYHFEPNRVRRGKEGGGIDRKSNSRRGYKKKTNTQVKQRTDREERDGQTCLHGACSSLTVCAEPPAAARAVLPAGSEQLSLQTLSKRKPSVQWYEPWKMGGGGSHVTGSHAPSSQLPSSVHCRLNARLEAADIDKPLHLHIEQSPRNSQTSVTRQAFFMFLFTSWACWRRGSPACTCTCRRCPLWGRSHCSAWSAARRWAQEEGPGSGAHTEPPGRTTDHPLDRWECCLCLQGKGRKGQMKKKKKKLSKKCL